MMKMVMAIVPRDQSDQVMEALIAAGHGITFSESRGGMLRQAQQMLFIAVDADVVPQVLDIVRSNCHTRVRVESGSSEDSSSASSRRIFATLHQLGGAVIFVWDLEHFETY